MPALAFRLWLVANGWEEDDIFIDLHGIGAGERWREALQKANVACEAIVLLASPDSLDSRECQREIAFAEDLGKEIIVATLRNVRKDDVRLARWSDRQFVDLAAEPLQPIEPFEHLGQLRRVSFSTTALKSIGLSLVRLGIAPGTFAWQPRESGAGPYPGLSAFLEEDAGIFFGRDAEIMSGITELRSMRRRRSSRLLVIQAASGAGKSSFLKAGLWPRLTRDTDFAPLAIVRPALGILSGPNGLGRQLAPSLAKHGRTLNPDDISGAVVAQGAPALGSLFSQATALATAARRVTAPDATPPAALIAIDQGEELFAAENTLEAEQFLRWLAAVLKEPPSDVDPYVLITVRADSAEALLQRVSALGLDTPRSLYLPPLSASVYRDVILKPARVYTERVRRLEIEPALADALAADATGADALPLLAFTLQRLFDEFGSDGKLTLVRYDGIGGTGGSIDRALAQAQRKVGPSGAPDKLRRLILPGLTSWDPAASAAKRLVAIEAELTSGNRTDLAPLTGALVDARLLIRGKGTIEVAHEALLRRPPIDGWIYQLKDSLKLRDNVLREATEWTTGGKSNSDLVRRGVRLRAAEALFSDPVFDAALAQSRDYLVRCRKQEDAVKSGARTIAFAVTGLIAGLLFLALYVFWQPLLRQYDWYVRTELMYARAAVWPFALTPERERALKPGDTFRECADNADVCQEMVVLPKGEYWMGLPDDESNGDEIPRHKVKIDYALAVAKFDVTWEAWDRCVSLGGCQGVPQDEGFGHAGYPMINVTWHEAKSYVDWLARVTGKPYRLLSESEWEYAARGVTTTDAPHSTFPWGSSIVDICKHANLADRSFLTRYTKDIVFNKDVVDCDDSAVATARVGSYPPNAFGLYDMQGNVWQWVSDAWHPNFKGEPPTNGAVWAGGEQSNIVIRGGSWDSSPILLRSGNRTSTNSSSREKGLGFRVARPLSPPLPGVPG